MAHRADELAIKYSSVSATITIYQLPTPRGESVVSLGAAFAPFGLMEKLLIDFDSFLVGISLKSLTVLAGCTSCEGGLHTVTAVSRANESI